MLTSGTYIYNFVCMYVQYIVEATGTHTIYAISTILYEHIVVCVKIYILYSHEDIQK